MAGQKALEWLLKAESAWPGSCLNFSSAEPGPGSRGSVSTTFFLVVLGALVLFYWLFVGFLVVLWWCLRAFWCFLEGFWCFFADGGVGGLTI